ncbi:MAG TPA: hypothetical protein VNL77_02560 [Roseiflexaceae bacterium]|nr:hypothetical protein [Roseiflexaceae bacterium]
MPIEIRRHPPILIAPPIYVANGAAVPPQALPGVVRPEEPPPPEVARARGLPLQLGCWWEPRFYER